MCISIFQFNWVKLVSTVVTCHNISMVAYKPVVCSTVVTAVLSQAFCYTKWCASYQIHKIAGCACAGNAGNVSPPSRVSDPDMHHHGTCVTHVPWCMPGSLTSGFLIWSWWLGERSWHSRRMRNPQFYVSGKRPMVECIVCWISLYNVPFPTL